MTTEPGAVSTSKTDKRADFPLVFDRLQAILARHAPPLTVTTETVTHYETLAKPTATYPAGVPFGVVQTKKSYVSFHLFPLYLFPDLRDGMPELLRQRMQGKTCFNFKRVDEPAMVALERLTAIGLERYRLANLV